MNVNESIDDNITLINNGAYGRVDINCTEPDAFPTLCKVVFYVTLTVGIPGNTLSAIVWLRHCIASKSSSAVYLAAVAINDIIYLLSTFLYFSDFVSIVQLGWLYDSARYLAVSAGTLEPLLVLGFSAERLFATVRPLQVRCMYS